MKTKIIVTVFLLIGLLSTVYALKYTANSVLYNSQIEEWNVSNVEEALNDLYLLNINNKELEWNSDTKELFIKKLPNDNSFKLFKVYSWPVENIDVFTSDGFDTGVSDGYTACARSGHNFAASVTDTINVASNENAGGGGIYTKKIDLTMYNKIVLTGYLTGKATTDSCGFYQLLQQQILGDLHILQQDM